MEINPKIKEKYFVSIFQSFKRIIPKIQVENADDDYYCEKNKEFVSKNSYKNKLSLNK